MESQFLFYQWDIRTFVKEETELEEKREGKNVEKVAKAGFMVVITNLPTIIYPFTNEWGQTPLGFQ